MHFSARQSKATNPPSHDEASRSPTRPVPSQHPLNHPLLKLQQTIGNQGVQRLLHSQPVQGLRPSQGGLLQRKCACGGTPGLDGECAECRQKRLSRQRHPTSQPEAAAVPPIVHEVLRSSGQALNPTARAFMEPRFGHDFGHVRVHTDDRAAKSAQSVDALAYTVGRDVIFGAGQYAPGSEGRHLLAHELTHVIQQGGGRMQEGARLKLGQKADTYEREADMAAHSIKSGLTGQQLPVQARLSVLQVQRQTESDEDLTVLDLEEDEEDAMEVRDGDSPVNVTPDSTNVLEEQLSLEGVMPAEAGEKGAVGAFFETAGSELIEGALAQAGAAADKDHPGSPPPKKKAPRKITKIDVDQAAQTMTIYWSDGEREGPRPVSTGKGRPNTPDDPCKTQTEYRCTPNGDFTVGRLGGGDTKNRDGARMSWYVGFVDSRGIGIHDSQPVPGTPDSHGCVRVGNSPADDAFAKKINKNVIPGSTVIHVFGKAATKPWTKAARAKRRKRKKK